MTRVRVAAARAPAALLGLLALAAVFQSTLSYQNTFFGALRPFTGQPAGPVTKPKIACLKTKAPPPFEDYLFRCSDVEVSEMRVSRGQREVHTACLHTPPPCADPHQWRLQGQEPSLAPIRRNYERMPHPSAHRCPDTANITDFFDIRGVYHR